MVVVDASPCVRWLGETVDCRKQKDWCRTTTACPAITTYEYAVLHFVVNTTITLVTTYFDVVETPNKGKVHEASRQVSSSKHPVTNNKPGRNEYI